MSIEMICLLLIAILGIHSTVTVIRLKRLDNIVNKLFRDYTNLDIILKSNDEIIKLHENLLNENNKSIDSLYDHITKIIELDKKDSERINTLIEYLDAISKYLEKYGITLDQPNKDNEEEDDNE